MNRQLTSFIQRGGNASRKAVVRGGKGGGREGEIEGGREGGRIGFLVTFQVSREMASLRMKKTKTKKEQCSNS